MLKTEEREGHQAFGSCSLTFTLPYISPKCSRVHSRIQFWSQNVFLENRFNLIQIRNVLCLSLKKQIQSYTLAKLKLFGGGGWILKTVKRKLHIPLISIHQNVHNEKPSRLDLPTRCLSDSLQRKGERGRITLTAAIWSLKKFFSTHLKANDPQGKVSMNQG